MTTTSSLVRDGGKAIDFVSDRIQAAEAALAQLTQPSRTTNFVGCSEGPIARQADLLQKDDLDKTSRERVKQASRELLASIKARLAELDRFWEKEQTKADVEVFILDEVFVKLPTPP